MAQIYLSCPPISGRNSVLHINDEYEGKRYQIIEDIWFPTLPQLPDLLPEKNSYRPRHKG